MWPFILLTSGSSGNKSDLDEKDWKKKISMVGHGVVAVAVVAVEAVVELLTVFKLAML